MKTVFIPKGETVRYESLTTEHLVVMGCLQVVDGIKAKTISGSGVISAGTVSADSICLDELEAAAVICKRLAAKRVMAPEVFASESVAVSCFLSAAYVETVKLTTALSELQEVKAQEIVHLPAKKRSLFGTLLASALRSFWTHLTARKHNGEVVDAQYVQVQEEAEKTAEEKETQMGAELKQPECAAAVPAMGDVEMQENDEELNRIVTLFKLLRKEGYTLRVVPGTPEENAPVFDFETERILRKAA